MINPLKPSKDPKTNIEDVVEDIYKHLTELKNLVMLGQERTGNDMTKIKIVEKAGTAKLAIRTSKGWMETGDDVFTNVEERG